VVDSQVSMGNCYSSHEVQVWYSQVGVLNIVLFELVNELIADHR